MNKVPIIRKGCIKAYWTNGFGGDFFIGIMVFLISLLDNSALNSFYFGLIAWVAIIVIWTGIGFTIEEYFLRKKRIKELISSKYALLDKQNFKLHEELYFEGIYNGYFFGVFPMIDRIKNGRGRIREIEYIVIESLYKFAPEATSFTPITIRMHKTLKTV